MPTKVARFDPNRPRPKRTLDKPKTRNPVSYMTTRRKRVRTAKRKKYFLHLLIIALLVCAAFFSGVSISLYLR